MIDKSRNSKGTGLGLTISKLLVENMGGQVESVLEDDLLKIKYKIPSI